MQTDPIGYSGGNNLYAYVGNDPLNFADPDGLVKDAINNFYNQTIIKAGSDIAGYARDAVNDPASFANSASATFGALGSAAGSAGKVIAAASEVVGAIKLLGSASGAVDSSSSASTEYRLTNTVSQNAATRPYVNSPLTIQEITSSATGVPDPGGIPGALRYDAPGTMSRPGASVGAPNATVTGKYELVIDPNSNTVYHFVFKSGP